jgi:ABC-2 type transport system ATP-binding protein
MDQPNGLDPRAPGDRVAIAVDGLTKRYGSAVAVDDLTFSVSYGRVVGFLGPNGAGKTTTLRALLGLIRPTAGTAVVAGRAYAALPDPVRTVGALLDAKAAHPGRSGRDHLRVLARAAGVADGRVDALIELVGLGNAAGRPVRGYSLGMRQRLAFAVALLGDPGVLVLDEPANGLDPEGMRWLRDLLRSFAHEGRAVLVSSHVLGEVAQSADDIVVVRQGRSVLQASLADVLTQHAGGVRVAGPDAAQLGDHLRLMGAQVSPASTDAIVIRGCGQEEVLHSVARYQLDVSEVSSFGASLEDIYLELTANPTGGTQ